jgi:DNA gyrase/topoisomerase IV subunit B
MPEIVKEGRLYVAEPPLYQLTRGKQIVYVANQKEYIDECITAVSDIEIEFPLVG